MLRNTTERIVCKWQPRPPLPYSGMDLSGLSDPFCVALWNDQEVGRTAVRHGTRDPDWVADDSKGVFMSGRSTRGGGWFDLPFLVPEKEKWGEEAWPPMCLEVSSWCKGLGIMVRYRRDTCGSEPVATDRGHLIFEGTRDSRIMISSRILHRASVSL